MKTFHLICFLAVIPMSVSSQPFSLDQSFDPNFNFFGGIGSHGALTSIIILPDNDIIVAGSFHFPRNNTIYGDMVRLRMDGTLVESFDYLVSLWAIGKMIDRKDSLFAIRMNSRNFYDYNGNFLYSPWYDNLEGDLDHWIEDIEFFDDNSALVGGADMIYEPDPTYQTRFNLVSLKPDGHVDTTFLHEPNNFVWYIDKYDNDRVLLSGKFTKYDSITISKLCRIYNNGEFDSTFNSPIISGYVIPLFVQNDGKILIGGSFWLEGDTIGSYEDYNARCLVRLLPNGDIDTTFNKIEFNGPIGYITYALCPTYDGGYLLGGRFTHYNGIPRKNIAKIDANGFLDTTVFYGLGFDTVYQTEDDARVRSITHGPNNTYYVLGMFDRYNGLQVDPIVRLHNEFYSIDEPNFETQQIQLYPNPANETIVVTADFIIEKIEIFTISGLKLKGLLVNDILKIFDVSCYDAGNYFARVVGKDKAAVKKFVVIR